MSDRGDADEVKSEPEEVKEPTPEPPKPKPEPVKQEVKKEPKEEPKKEEPVQDEQTYDDEDTVEHRVSFMEEKTQDGGASNGTELEITEEKKDGKDEDINNSEASRSEDTIKSNEVIEKLVDNNQQSQEETDDDVKSTSETQQNVKPPDGSENNATPINDSEEIKDEQTEVEKQIENKPSEDEQKRDDKVKESVQDSDDRSHENEMENGDKTNKGEMDTDDKPSEIESEKQIDSKADEKEQQSNTGDKEIQDEETPKESEKPKDEYVPLDKLWSSPKREFKGVQGEYKFNSRISSLSTSSYRSPSPDKVDQKSEPKSDERLASNNDEVTTGKSEATVEEKERDEEGDGAKVKDDSQVIAEVRHENDAGRDVDKSDEFEEKRKSDDVLYDDDVTSTEDKSPENENMRSVSPHDKDEDKMISQNDDKHSETMVQEVQHEDESIQQEKDQSELDVSQKENEAEETPLSPRRTRSRTESGSSRSLSGSPRTPPPSKIIWEKDDGTANDDKYDDDGFESDESDKKSKSQKKADSDPDRTNTSETKETPSSKKENDTSKKDKSISPRVIDAQKDGSASQREANSNQQRAISSPRQIIASERRTQRPVAKSATLTRDKESPRALSLAQANSPRSSYIRYSKSSPRPKTKPRPRTTTATNRSIGNKPQKRKSLLPKRGVTASEEGRKRQKEFFKAELHRLERGLEKESGKISRPKQRAYYPFVWTSLEPYYNTYVARYLIDVAEDPRPGFVSRNTAIGLTDPWVDLRMDRDLLPRLETPARSKRRQEAKEMRESQKKDKKGKKPPKEGSTRLPKFPVVDFNTQKENATKCFPYYEVPKFREGMKGRFGQEAKKRVDSDYERTKADFYRMDLDRLDEVHPINRPHMRKAYFAYLQNTPGSKKAIKECVKTLPKNEDGSVVSQTQQSQKAN